MTSITLDKTNDSLVAVAICSFASFKYDITADSSELTFKDSDNEFKGSDVVDHLVKQFPLVKGSNDEEQKEVESWLSKKVNINDLNNHLKLRVYIADGITPTLADFVIFANLRSQISKQKQPQRNQFVNVTRWFNHLQKYFSPYFTSVLVKLTYTPPKKEDKKQKTENKNGKQNQRRQAPAKAVGFGRLCLQVGKITSIEVHPTVKSLYVEKIDLGEAENRTVVSKLAEKVPIDEMKDRFVIVVSNLQPVNLQGVTSAGLVLCASKGDDVEVLSPPEGSKIGEQIQVKDTIIIPGENISGKIFSKAVKGLETNNESIACYKNIPLTTTKGNVFVKSLKGALIK